MSKISNKARYVQLKEWLESRGTKASAGRQPKQQFSKADYYKQKQ